MRADPLASAFESTPAGLFFLDGDDRILRANPAFLRLAGGLTGVGERFSLCLPPEDRGRWAEAARQVRAGGGSARFESASADRDRGPAWWSLDLSRAPGADEPVFVVVNDLSAHRAEEDVLREARLQAEGASRAKSEFLANMSHEIRTPLFTITGMADLLRLGDLSRDQAHHAGQIASAAQHLLDLVNDVLDFSKIEAGQMSLESIPLDLDEVVGRSLEVVSLTAYRKGLELLCDLDPRLSPRRLGDPSRLRQVLVNLLGNAVKFTPKGGRVGLKVSAQGADGLRFAVRDTGIGLSEAAQANLFRVFTQADSSTTRQYGGTGLGLAISQRLVGMLGGTIEVRSRPGEGAEFFFTIHLAHEEGPRPELPPGRGRQVLLVDDDEGARSVLADHLTGAGFRVDAVADRAQAHSSLARSRPDVMLIDQELGPEDGWQLASEVRAEPATADLPLVLMSLLRKTLEPSPRYPADLFRCFLDKPVNPRWLIERLDRGLGDGQGGDWSDPPAAGPGSVGPLVDRRAARRLRVLVAEDHEVNRELFRLLLQSLGHETFLVENGREACDAAPFVKPDLVFMDLQMPVLNGYEASRELRALGLSCPIVAVTASALKGELERCRAAGMNSILTKPFNRDTLDAVLRSYGPRPDFELKAEPDLEPEPEPVTPSGEAGPAFDYDEALKVFLGNRDLLASLIVRFRTQTADLVRTLHEAVQAGDAAAVRSAAHAIKGSAANLCARPLAEAAKTLELAAAAADLTHAPAQAEAVGQRFREFLSVTGEARRA